MRRQPDQQAAAKILEWRPRRQAGRVPPDPTDLTAAGAGSYAIAERALTHLRGHYGVHVSEEGERVLRALAQLGPVACIEVLSWVGQAVLRARIDGEQAVAEAESR